MADMDLIAMWIGYTLMTGTASLAASVVLMWGMKTMFWKMPGEAAAFLKFMRWKAQGKPEAPHDPR